MKKIYIHFSIFVLFLAIILAFSGCGRKNAPVVEKPAVEKNSEQKIEEKNITKEELTVWPEISFTEEDYKGWKTYTNTELGYSIKYPADWTVDACKKEECLSGQVIINPPVHEPYVAYIGMAIDDRNMELIRKVEYEYFPDTIEKKIIFGGKESYQFSKSTNNDRVEIKIILNDGVFDITTDRRYNENVLQALSSFKFID